MLTFTQHCGIIIKYIVIGKCRLMKIKELFTGETDNTFIQFFRYLFVGGFAFVVDYGTLMLLVEVFGFNAKLGISGQPEIFYKAQWPLFMLLPALGSILYLIPFMFIKYSKAQREQVEKELAERHAAEQKEA